MQTLEDRKDALGMLGIESNAIVLHGEYPFGILSLNRDIDTRDSLSVELDGVANQVLEELSQLYGICCNSR